HITLYEALEASMDHDNMEEFVKATAKSRKRRRDDQDPPPPHQRTLTKARRISMILMSLLRKHALKHQHNVGEFIGLCMYIK
ncbi:hypothetical protein Tco_0358010, partial [Tanacetum coccineum]